MAASAQNGHAAVDHVGADEPGAAAGARLTGASVHREALDEAASRPLGIAIIAKAGTARGNRFPEHGDKGIAEGYGFVCSDVTTRARGIDTGAPERLVRIDVSNPRNRPLIHQKLLDRLSGSPKKAR